MRLSRSLRSFWSTEIWCREEIALAVLAGSTASLPAVASIPLLACCAIASLFETSMATWTCSASWLCSQLGAGLLGFIHRLLQPGCLAPQDYSRRRTGRVAEDELGRSVAVAGALGLGIIGFVLFLGGLVTVELALNPAEAVSPGADQVSFDVFQFILIEFQLRLGQVDLLLQAHPRARSSFALAICFCSWSILS